MAEQLGMKMVGQTTYKKLFKSGLGPSDVVAVVLPGSTAATYVTGQALINSSTSGLKQKYTNATSVNNESVGTGDGSTTTFDLAHANVIASSLKAFAAGVQRGVTLSPGTGSGGVDQIIFDVAPASGAAITADYDYHATAIGTTGACVLMEDVTTTASSNNVTTDGCRDGSVDSTMVVDANGNAVDDYFKAALPKMVFD